MKKSSFTLHVLSAHLCLVLAQRKDQKRWLLSDESRNNQLQSLKESMKKI